MSIAPSGVYTDVTDAPTPVFWPDWRVFRSHLNRERKDYLGSNAAVLTDPRIIYPASGPSVNYSSVVSSTAAAYVEFLRPTTIGANTTLSVTMNVYLNYANAGDYIRISALPIQNFNTLPHPNNQFVPSIYVTDPGRVTYRSVFRVVNFDQCNRTTVIINNLFRPSFFEYAYTAELISPNPQPAPPCTLIVP